LETAWCIHIQQRYPGIEPIEPGDKELARIELKLDEEEQLVVALIDPRNSPEQAELLDREFPRTKERVPYAKLQLVHDFEAEITKIHAADLVVSVSKNGAVSVPIAQAMSMRKVVMIPQEGALPEMVEDRLSGMVFSDDDLLGDSIASALQMPLTLETMENAARIRFNERFAMDDYAEWLCELYLEIAN
jgi:glycosyltransferase involved in cell wall biosynthesis